MNKTIYRTIGKNAHVLNVSTGDVMTFEMSKQEIINLFENWTTPELELDQDVKTLFAVQRQTNTRLCRGNLNNLGMKFGFPTIVNIETNRRCSMKCIHCYIGAEHLKSPIPSLFEQMSEKILSSFFDELVEMGVFLLVFTGGEPFLNTRFEQILKLALDKGFVVEIFSNLQHIPIWFEEIDPDQSLIGRIQVSIYSSNPVVHDKITTVNGSHQRSMKNLEKLRKKGFYVEIATPLMKDNFDSWEDTKRFFVKMGVKQDFSWPIVSEYYSKKSGKSSLNITTRQFRQFIEKNPEFLIKTEFKDPHSPICEAGKSIFGISANGDVFPCSQLPYSVGNISKTSVRSIYESKGMQRFRDLKNINTGLKVAYNYCIGENYVETGNLLTQPEFVAISIESALQQKGGNRE